MGIFLCSNNIAFRSILFSYAKFIYKEVVFYSLNTYLYIYIGQIVNLEKGQERILSVC